MKNDEINVFGAITLLHIFPEMLINAGRESM